jgi:exonuclease SbcC
MRLHRLKLLNFRQHASTEIVFGSGITAIIGPNGSGKTTLLEAIAWAFYGNPAARGSRDSIRWNRAAARASVRVEVEFGLGAHEFRVARGLYAAEFYQDRFDAPTAVGHQEVTSRVARLLGMSRTEFFSTYFTGQKELAVMASLGPADRARFLSRVLGYEKLKLAQDRLRETRSSLRGELAGLERGLADPDELKRDYDAAAERLAEVKREAAAAETATTAARQRLDREGPVWTKMVALRERSLALDGERRIAERDVGEARREFERLDRELADALAAKSSLEELASDLEAVDPLKEELDRLEREAQNAGRRRSVTGQLSELSGQTERTIQRLDRLSSIGDALQQARAELETARRGLQEAERSEADARTVWVRAKQDAETKRQNLRDQYLDHQKHRQSVLSAGADGECPICRRPLGAVYQTVLETLGRQMEEIEVKGKFFKQRIEQLQKQPPEVGDAERAAQEARTHVEHTVQEVARCEDRVREEKEMRSELERLQARRQELENEIAQLSDAYDASRHEEVRQQLRALEPTIRTAAELGIKASRAEALVQEAEAAERNASERETRARDFAEALQSLGFSEQAFAEARARYEEAEAERQETELRVASVQGDLRAAEAAATHAKRRIEERRERADRIQETKTELALHDELDRALQDLRAELNAAMRPELAERASDFLGSLTDGRYAELELDEHYEVLIVEDGQAKPVISGGEEDMLHLSLRLAISQMVAERAGQPLSLLVLDEIFGSLDEARRHNVVALLRGLADRFPQVILITHIESVRDGVDRVLRVELDEETGAARLTDDEIPVGGADVAA